MSPPPASPAPERAGGPRGARWRAVLGRHPVLLALLPGLWLSLAMPVFAQEAYYWTYSLRPALSYFDHPPMVAWLIWLGTHVLGDGAIGLRLLTFLCGAGVLLGGVQLVRDLGLGRRTERAWLLLSSCVPILLMTRFLANPDAPLALFWMACLLALWRAREGRLRWWLLAGLAAGCALLSKYTAAFLGLGGVLVLLFDSRMRAQLLRPGPWVGVAVAAVTFLPVVGWDAGNDFESFRFQTEGRWARAELSWHQLGRFVSGQLGVFNPVIALLLPPALLWLWRRAGRAGRDPRALWLLAFGLPLPLFFLANALVMRVKINWLVPGYLALLLGLAWWWGESGLADRRPRLVRRLEFAVLLVLAVLPLAPLIRLVPQQRSSSWAGWPEIAACAERWEERIDAEDHVEGNVFFFAADYKDAAQLTRNLRLLGQRRPAAPPIEPTLAQNVFGEPALQFDHWEPPAHHLGQDAIFVLPRPGHRQRMLDLTRRCFTRTDLVEQVHVRRLGIDVLDADVYVCRGYLGAGGR